MPDSWQREHGLNPDMVDNNDDPDGDDWVNEYEHLYRTDPYSSDSDGDEIPDGEEVRSGRNPAQPGAPPTAEAGGPYSGAVGQAIIFDARGSFDPMGQLCSMNGTGTLTAYTTKARQSRSLRTPGLQSTTAPSSCVSQITTG